MRETSISHRIEVSSTSPLSMGYLRFMCPFKPRYGQKQVNVQKNNKFIIEEAVTINFLEIDGLFFRTKGSKNIRLEDLFLRC